MSEQAKGASELVGITLTELLIVLLFITLVLFTSLVADREEEIGRQVSEKDTLEKRLSEIASLFEVEENSDTFFSKLVEQKQLAEMVSESGEVDTQFIAEQLALQKELALILGTEESKESLLEKASSLADELALTASANRELLQEAENKTGQLVRLQDALNKNGGAGIPPCWVDQKGQIEHLFRVLIVNSRVAVEKGYPDHRAESFRMLPEASKVLEEKIMGVSAFNTLTRPIYDWSTKQEPECRHYIEIFDQSTDAAQLRVNFKRIQNNFYPSYKPKTTPPETLQFLFSSFEGRNPPSQSEQESSPLRSIEEVSQISPTAETEGLVVPKELPAPNREVSRVPERDVVCDKINGTRLRKVSVGDSESKVEKLIGAPCRLGRTPDGNSVWLYSEDNDRAYVVFRRGRVISVAAKS